MSNSAGFCCGTDKANTMAVAPTRTIRTSSSNKLQLPEYLHLKFFYRLDVLLPNTVSKHRRQIHTTIILRSLHFTNQLHGHSTLFNFTSMHNAHTTMTMTTFTTTAANATVTLFNQSVFLRSPEVILLHTLLLISLLILLLSKYFIKVRILL